MLFLVPKTTLYNLITIDGQYRQRYRRSYETHYSFHYPDKNFHEMDFIREVKKNIKLATERLHEDYRKMYKTHQFV